MGTIKEIAIKVENGDLLTKDEFVVAKAAGYNGIKVGLKYCAVNWKDDVINIIMEDIYNDDFFVSIYATFEDDVYVLYKTFFNNKDIQPLDDFDELEEDEVIELLKKISFNKTM